MNVVQREIHFIGGLFARRCFVFKELKIGIICRFTSGLPSFISLLLLLIPKICKQATRFPFNAVAWYFYYAFNEILLARKLYFTCKLRRWCKKLRVPATNSLSFCNNNCYDLLPMVFDLFAAK